MTSKFLNYQEHSNHNNEIIDYNDINLNDNHNNYDEEEMEEYENKPIFDYKEEPIQLITFDALGFKLNPEALQILSSIEEDIVVVAIVGKARTGKSYLMNLLLDNVAKGKGVSHKIIK